MKCHFCKSDTTVIDSRRGSSPNDKQNRRYRRRECLECGKRFTTFERWEFDPAEMNRNKLGHLARWDNTQKKKMKAVLLEMVGVKGANNA